MTDKRMDPSTRFVRSLDGEYFMLREVAQMIGISSQTLRKTVHDKKLEAPSFWVMFGKLKIYLYTRDDIDELRQYLKDRAEVFRVGEGPVPKVGRPRKYTVEQRQEKQREYARAYYWRKRLAKAQKEDNKDAIYKAKGKLYELEKQMAEFDEEVAEAPKADLTTTTMNAGYENTKVTYSDDLSPTTS